MDLFLRKERIQQKHLAGLHMKMSLAQNKTVELWKNFMPKRNEIKSRIGTEYYSCEVYPPFYFDRFDPQNKFEKWAAVAVSEERDIPEGMEILVIPDGDYAVFIHRGSNAEAFKTYGYIFREWLPGSEFTLDNRPHFALMGEKYKKDEPSSEEEIWIPVKARE